MLVRILKYNRLLKIVTTSFLFYILFVFQPEITSHHLLILILIICFQSFLQLYNKVYSSICPLIVMDEEEKLQKKNTLHFIAWGFSFLPLSFLISNQLAWFLVFLMCVYIFSLTCKILLRWVKRKEVASNKNFSVVTNTNPLIMIYVAGSPGVAYQINQWIPVLEALNLSFLIMVRARSTFSAITPTKIPIVFAKNIKHVGTVLEEWGVRTVLYPANHRLNIQAMRYSELNHFFINHGESDKAVNQSKMMLIYDKLLVAGAMAYKRLLNSGIKVAEDKIEFVGRPQLDLLLSKKLKGGQGIKKILYAPTWEGYVKSVNYSSIQEIGLNLLNTLIDSGRYEVSFKPHPYTGLQSETTKNYLKAMVSLCRKNGIKVFDSMTPIHECMNDSDVLITDISSVLSDYLMTDKPIILCVNNLMSEVDLSGDFPTSAAAYPMGRDTNLMLLLDEIDRNDPMKADRKTIKSEVFGDDDDSSLSRFETVLKASLINNENS